MAPKRKNEDESTARERKKQKTAVARTIAVQSTTASTMPANAAAGPSKSVAFVDSKSSLYSSGLPYMLLELMFDRVGMKGLPSVLDVEKFAEVPLFLLMDLT